MANVSPPARAQELAPQLRREWDWTGLACRRAAGWAGQGCWWVLRWARLGLAWASGVLS